MKIKQALHCFFHEFKRLSLISLDLQVFGNLIYSQRPMMLLSNFYYIILLYKLVLDSLLILLHMVDSVQFSSVTQLCLTLCNPMNCSTPGLPVHHQLPESTQTHVH